MSDEVTGILAHNDDLFHHGVITKLFPSNNTGIVRIESGREVFFSYEFVILTGEAKSPLHLKVGQPVGYDLGWTPSGLRVTKIKTYPTSSVVQAADTSKRQGS
ncbi:MAG: hypothetical protein K0Q83_442 [Deltaproteobacteria bacterium]|jgi:hypothetical protein|nr:hypothetical protein [Deltaproteobacteria bacterium]